MPANDAPWSRGGHNAMAITDLFGSLDDVPHTARAGLGAAMGEKGALFSMSSRPLSFRRRIGFAFSTIRFSQWILLTLLGAITALVVLCMEYCVVNIYSLRVEAPLWVFFLTGPILAIGAVSCVHFGSMAALGSGVPQMKATLGYEGGLRMLRFLWGEICDEIWYRCWEKRQLKRLEEELVIGLGCGIAAGMTIGSEGPFVHVSGCIANALSRYLPEKWFRRYYTYETFRLQLLAVAVSTGVTATFGAPVGGVIFAVEVTAIYFFVSNLSRAFYSSIVCVLVYRISRESGIVDLFEVDFIPDWTLHWELVIFCLLAAFCGVLAGLVVYCIGYINRYTTKLPTVWRFIWAACVTLAIAGISCAFPVLKRLDKKLLKLLFSPEEDTTQLYYDTMHSIGDLAALLGVKCATFVLSLSCHIPAGVFTPTFVIGALCGRFAGVVMNELFPDAGLASPALYSLIGAVSVTAGVTRTVSVAVIAFELTGQIHNMTPILLCTLISYTVSAMLTISIYDVLLHLRNLPYLPHLRSSELYHHTCRDLAVPINAAYCISQPKMHGHDVPLITAYDASKRLPKGCDKVPVVEFDSSGSSMLLRGVVPAVDIVSEVREALKESHLPRDTTDAEKKDIISLRPLELESLLTEVGKGADWSPIAVPESLPVARVQYMFTMLRLKSLFVVQKGTNCLIGVITKDCFEASSEERVAWGEGKLRDGHYWPGRRPGSYSCSWAEDWHLSSRSSTGGSSDGVAAAAADDDVETGCQLGALAPLDGDLEALSPIEGKSSSEGPWSSEASDTKNDINYSNQDTTATRYGGSISAFTSPGSASSPGDCRRAHHHLLKVARELSRSPGSPPLRWLEVSDATLELVRHRAGIRLVEALEVARLMASSEVTDSSLRTALIEWLNESRDESAVSTGVLMDEARLAMDVFGLDHPSAIKSCRKIIRRAKDMSSADLVVAWSLLINVAGLSYSDWSSLLISTISHVQTMSYIQAAQIATVLAESRSQEWQKQVDNADLLLMLDSILKSHQTSLCESLPLPSLLRVAETMTAVEEPPEEFRNQQRRAEQSLLERIKIWQGDLPRSLDCGAIAKRHGRHLEKPHLERMAQWALANTKRRSMMSTDDLIAIWDACVKVGLDDMSDIDEAIRWWLCFKWKYDSEKSVEPNHDSQEAASQSACMSLIKSVHVQARPEACTRLFLKMFGDEVMKHRGYLEGQLITVLLETTEAMTVVSQISKRTLEEVDRIVSEAVPLIAKELEGGARFLFVDPSTLRLCDSSGDEVSSFDFDPFDELLTHKLGYSVVELGCCRALAAPGFGARVQVAYFLLYDRHVDSTCASEKLPHSPSSCQLTFEVGEHCCPMKRYLLAGLVTVVEPLGPDISAMECWVGGFTPQYCCKADVAERPECWSGGINYDDCCPNAECWSSGYSYSTCCNSTLHGPQGNPVCWDGELFTAESCCEMNRGALSWYEAMFLPIPMDEIYSLSEFYTDSQYGPDFGYYSRGRVISQAKIDLNGATTEEFSHFTTYPMALSPHFAFVICRKLFIMWMVSGMPDYFPIVEFGAGSGQLGSDILECLAHPPFDTKGLASRWAKASQYVIVERSPALAARQRKRGLNVVEADAQSAESTCPRVRQQLRHEWFGAGVALSNELLDAFAPAKLRLSVFATNVTACSSWQEVRIAHVISFEDLLDTYGMLGVSKAAAESYVAQLEQQSRTISCSIVESSVGRAAMEALNKTKCNEDAKQDCIAVVLALSRLIDHTDLQLPHAAHNMRIRLRNDINLQNRLMMLVEEEHKLLIAKGPRPILIGKHVYRELRHLMRDHEAAEIQLVHLMTTRRLSVALSPDTCRQFAPWMRRNAKSIMTIARRYREMGHVSVAFSVRHGEEEYVQLVDCILGGRGFILSIDYGAPFEPLAHSVSSSPFEDGVAVPPIPPSSIAAGLPDDCQANWMKCPGFVDLTSFVDFTNVARAGEELGWNTILYGPQNLLEKLAPAPTSSARVPLPSLYSIHDHMSLDHPAARHMRSWYGHDELEGVQRWTGFKVLVQSRGTPAELALVVTEGAISWHLSSEEKDPCWRVDISEVPQADVVDRLGILTLFEHDHEATAREYARGYENAQLSVQLIDFVKFGTKNSDHLLKWNDIWGFRIAHVISFEDLLNTYGMLGVSKAAAESYVAQLEQQSLYGKAMVSLDDPIEKFQNLFVCRRV
ncbi:Chloride Channel [Perkinsus chesapeaki]|uniref:type II protein arginine methyltransferase n=1 Tax=Perkinsus chesapeaki TaxID=330153 RepID=A0A7J6N011_PERCH|nr:Chloride Channel [Perkinsus chesapeaki]